MHIYMSAKINKRYKFYLKRVGSLTRKEKGQMMRLMIATYPAFRKYYLKNKYYSTVKPQMENLIKDGNEIIGLGKILWRRIIIGQKSINLFALGVLIDKKHQKQGLGSSLIARNIKKAKSLGADILYGSTSNRIAEKILKKFDFQKLNVPVFYKDVESEKIQKEKDRVWIFEFKKGISKDIQKLKKIYIGSGPL